jgi:hypothetical protein
MQDVMPGDILFYTATPGNVAENAIVLWTHSPYCHVAVALSALEKIEALSQCVVVNPLDLSRVAAVYRFSATAEYTSGKNLQVMTALQWLRGQVGTMYGWGDIVDAVLTRFETSVTITTLDHHDCSSLATDFLIRAGCKVVIEDKRTQDPHLVTPGDLADVVGIASGTGTHVVTSIAPQS